MGIYKIRTTGRLIVICLLSATLLITAGCKKQELETHWSDKPIVIDGKIDDWADIPTNFFEDQGASVGLCSDDKNYYIHFRFRSAKMARTIRMTGMNIWIDLDGGTGKDLGIRYSGGPNMKDLMAGRGGGDVPPEMTDRMAGKMPNRPEEFIFIDKEGLIEAAMSPDGSNGPAVAYDTSMGFHSYEFSIPMKESTARNYGINAVPGQEIGLGAIWGDVDIDEMRSGRGGGKSGGSPGGGMGGGRGGMGGGRGGMGGGRGGMGGSRPEMPEKQELWVRTTIATQQTVAKQDGE